MLRRRFVLGGLLTVLDCAAPVLRCAAAAGLDGRTGCWVPNDEVSGLFSRAGRAGLYETGDEDIERRSGNLELDRALAHSLATLSRMFEVLPAFEYYHDGVGHENARATPNKLLDRADGGRRRCIDGALQRRHVSWATLLLRRAEPLANHVTCSVGWPRR